MARSKNPSRSGGINRAEREKPEFQSPFKDLKKLLAQRDLKNANTVAKVLVAAVPAKTATAIADDDEAVLREALAGVRPLSGKAKVRVAPKPKIVRNVVSEDAEVLAQLSDLVSGQAPFDITETEEYVEGARVGLDPRLLSGLRRGEFAVQAHIDLHGMIQADARPALETFVLESVSKARRTVLVVHGRGRRSPGGQPILKRAAAKWLSHGMLGAHVLAFATARPHDGGAGAMYVMLRRNRKRGAFDVLEGAKRRD
ncbi:MAG: Smr/MutS family protein [Candidatus Binataceae bacterium]